jgi:hypothetical protein
MVEPSDVTIRHDFGLTVAVRYMTLCPDMAAQSVRTRTYTALVTGSLALAFVGCSAPSDTSPEAPVAPGNSAAEPSPMSGNGEDDEVPSEAPSAPPVSTADQPAPELPSEQPAGEGLAGEEPPPLPQLRDTMTTSGRQLFDSCGNVFVTRGVEQIFGEQLPQGNDWTGLVEQVARTGANAIRILPRTETLSVSNIGELLDVIAEHDMVGYVTPYGPENIAWLQREDVKAMLAEHEQHIIIDAFGEPTFDDRARFVRDSTAAIQRVRSWGYRVPLTVTANQFGRDLPSLLELGEEIIAADPLNNTILGWQAYWGNSGFYERKYEMSLSEAMQAVARAPFPMQLGLDRVTDYPSTETADFTMLLSGTQANGVGWLWWDWYNPYGNENNLTNDGSANNLTPTGQVVLASHAASNAKTSKRRCVRSTSE